MKPNDPHQPFDAEADFADEDSSNLTSEFWRGDRQWVSKSNGKRRPPSESAEPVTGTVRAIKAGFAAFRPRTVEGAGRTDRDRTREHGIVRPGQQPSSDDARRSTRSNASAAVPLATREVSIAELAGEWLDEPMPHRSPTRSPHRHSSGPRPIRDEMADARRTTRQPIVAPRLVEDDVHGYDDGYFDDDHEVALTPVASLSSRLGLGAVDPLLARVGAMVLVALMLVPVALAVGSGNETPTALGESLPPPAALSEFTESTNAPSAATVAADAPVADAAPAASNSIASKNATNQNAAVEAPTAEPVIFESAQAITNTVATTMLARNVEANDGALTEAAVVEEQAQRIPCGDSYTIVRNDSWYRIAGAADVSMNDLLDVNMATTQTVLLVGADICLPQGASIAAPTTTAAPATTAAPTTTAAPSTTAAPTTTTAVIPNVTTAEVQQLIRDIFPDDQEAKALDVAFRESRYIATADNGTCCVGVFQLHWTAHRSWLDDFGIYTRNDLKHAEKNIRAAYALYQSSGWGPWGG